MRLAEVLAGIGREPHAISRGSTVDEAVRLMAEKKTGALIVLEGEEPAGIFTGTDLVRTHVKCGGRPLTGIGIREVMTDKPIVAEAEDDIDRCVEIMLQNGVSHLPIVKDGRIAGLLFLRDLLQHKIEWLTAELDTLHEYLSDLRNAGID